MEQALAAFIQFARWRHDSIEIAMSKGENTMSQIAIGSYQLVIVTAQEFSPGKVAVPGLRHIRRQGISQSIRVISFQVIM